MFNHKTDWKTVPVPWRIESLPKDPKGMPVPYVVLRTPDHNDPTDYTASTGSHYHFAINDSLLVQDCAENHLCTICGHGLQDDTWVIGGPLSAFMPNGVFADLPVHHDCGKYALQVCPYLAIPSYVKVRDVLKEAKKRGLALDNVSEGNTKVAFFVFAKLNQYTIPGGNLVRPLRNHPPVFREIQYWYNGEQITPAKAVELQNAAAPAVVTLLNSKD